MEAGLLLFDKGRVSLFSATLKKSLCNQLPALFLCHASTLCALGLLALWVDTKIYLDGTHHTGATGEVQMIPPFHKKTCINDST